MPINCPQQGFNLILFSTVLPKVEHKIFLKMKTKIIMLLCAAFMSKAVFAQKISSAKVPAAVISAFKTKFPTLAKPSWEMESDNVYEAEFKLNGGEVSSNFDQSGKWLETETEIKISDLPLTVQNALKKDFADFKIEEASKIERTKEGNCFEAEIKKGSETFDVLYTPDGKMLSKSKEEKKKKD